MPDASDDTVLAIVNKLECPFEYENERAGTVTSSNDVIEQSDKRKCLDR